MTTVKTLLLNFKLLYYKLRSTFAINENPRFKDWQFYTELTCMTTEFKVTLLTLSDVLLGF